jgi:hypothetical protein
MMIDERRGALLYGISFDPYFWGAYVALIDGDAVGDVELITIEPDIFGRPSVYTDHGRIIMKAFKGE